MCQLYLHTDSILIKSWHIIAAEWIYKIYLLVLNACYWQAPSRQQPFTNSGSKASYNGPGKTSLHIYILFLEVPLTNWGTLIQITHTLFCRKWLTSSIRYCSWRHYQSLKQCQISSENFMQLQNNWFEKNTFSYIFKYQ